MPELFRARSDWQQTVDRAAEVLDLDPVAVEKDYWVCQALRGLSSGETAENLVFKGGTSLEKLRLTQRFSEDIDLLVLVPNGLSKKAHEKYLKKVVADAIVEGITPDTEQNAGGKPGSFHRDVYLHYRERVEGARGIVDQGRVLLEIGESGGPHPHRSADVTSLLGRQLTSAGVDVTGYQDLAPFTMQFLHPGRTLLEKLLRVESFITAPAAAKDPDKQWVRIGRQFYDIHMLLGDAEVLELLSDTVQVQTILASAATISQAFSTVAVPRPVGGFATSAAFDVDGPWAARLRAEHEKAMTEMYYGSATPPTFDEVCAHVQAHAALL